jgi:hypothetical protein
VRDYALIWNKRIERYEVFDLRDSKRQRNVLGTVPAGFIHASVREDALPVVETAGDRLAAQWREQ